MYSHVHVGARDLPLMVDFYDSVLSQLGLVQMPGGNGGRAPGAGWQLPGKRWPQFFVQAPENGDQATSGNGVQVSFCTESQLMVRNAWEVALQQGAKDEGAPGYRPCYADDFYAAYCRDPEGNKLCFVFTPDMKG